MTKIARILAGTAALALAVFACAAQAQHRVGLLQLAKCQHPCDGANLLLEFYGCQRTCRYWGALVNQRGRR